MLLKLIAKQVAEAGSTGDKTISDDDLKLLREVAQREIGDDAVTLPSGICAADKKLLEKIAKSKSGVAAVEAVEDVSVDAEK